MTTINAYNDIKRILENARDNSFRAVNFFMVQAYWNIGRVIVEEELKDGNRADYGKELIEKLSTKLLAEYGTGFSRSNLNRMRQFYLAFKNCAALPRKLSWTHFCLLLSVENKLARDFYTVECEDCGWSTRELERQIYSLLFERLALSRDKKGVLELAKKGQVIQKPADIIKEPYIFEFLGLKENHRESELEEALVDKLKEFLLELGKGFSLVARQKRITVEDDHYYVDLVFYNYILDCFFLVDLKLGKLTHQDIGQMDFYLRYFEENEKKPAVGLILCSYKNETMVKYTSLKDKKIYASKYRLYLPSVKQLKKEVKRITQDFNISPI